MFQDDLKFAFDVSWAGIEDVLTTHFANTLALHSRGVARGLD